MDAATIVKRIRALSGITRKELAELADLSPSTIGRIEKATLDPTWGTLSRVLEATGYQISGDTVVSAGDPTAIAAALPVLELRTDVVAPRADQQVEGISVWQRRWARAGWLSDAADADDTVTVAIAAGNAAKIARRNVARRVVVADAGWRDLARRLGEAGIDYAVSGLIAARRDRATASAMNPVIYVADPARSVEELGLDQTSAGRGVLLLASDGGELTQTEVDGGIRFVSRAQGVLDAFAGSGRDPDKAEDVLRSLLAESR